MPVQPIADKAIISQTSLPSIKWRLIAFLILIVLAASLLIFNYFYAQQKARQGSQDKVAAFITQFKDETADINIQGSLWRNRFNDYLNQAAAEKDPQKRFVLLFKDFEILKSVYLANQEPKARKLAEELKNLLAVNFPEFYKEEQFAISCLDAECGKIEYPEEIKKIVALFGQMKFPSDTDYQKLIQNGFDRAVLSNRPEEQWSAYNLARQYFWIAYHKNKDVRVKEGGLVLLDFLKKNFSSQYQLTVQVYGEEKFRFD